MSIPVVLCPHPPLLHRELGGLADPVAELRAACTTALRSLLDAGPETVAVVGPTDTAGSWDPALRPDVRRFGTTGERSSRQGLPQSLGVGRRLLDDAGWTGPTLLLGLPDDATPGDLEAVVDELRERSRSGSLALLLLGDGSTRRGDKAPGFLDPRAFPFDDAVASALDGGDAAALRALDTGLARELMVDGAPVLRLLGTLGVAGGVQGSELAYRDDPHGVSYFVARWVLGDLSASG
jgi:hypothetical protein